MTQLKIVDPETANLAYKAEFDWQTIGYYTQDGIFHEDMHQNFHPMCEDISAPTQELVRKWLRDEYELYILPCIRDDGDGEVWMNYDVWSENWQDYLALNQDLFKFSTEESAIEHALYQVLQYLLEGGSN